MFSLFLLLLFLFFSFVRRFSRGRERKKVQTLTIFMFASFSNNQQDTALMPTCTSTGWATSRSPCREERKRGKERDVGQRERFLLTCFFAFLSLLGFSPRKNFQSLQILFCFRHDACVCVCVCACALFVPLSVGGALTPRARARFNFVPPPRFNFFSFSLFDPGLAALISFSSSLVYSTLPSPPRVQKM